MSVRFNKATIKTQLSFRWLGVCEQFPVEPSIVDVARDAVGLSVWG